MGPLLLSFVIILTLQYSTSLIVDDDDWFPRYHLTSMNGWMNDPNGLIEYDGYYHAFFQHCPGDLDPGCVKTWAHARSKNMLNWEFLDEALKPSIEHDIDGCFSGYAVEDKNGTLILIYTGVSTVNNTVHQVQCLAASSDKGFNFEKLGKVIESDVYFSDFRDPKVFKQGDFYYAVLVTMNTTDNTENGQVVLYKSPDLYHWESQGILAGPIDNFGFMWECPDLYTLNGKQILSFSVEFRTNTNAIGKIHSTGYQVGSWKPGDDKFTVEKPYVRFDEGHDFYASQTFLAKDGRRIMMAWMNMWETPFPEATRGWIGTLTLPRELTLSKDGRVESNPIREIIDFRCNLHRKEEAVVKDSTFLLESNSTLCKEIEFEWDLKETNATSFGVQISGTEESEGLFFFLNQTSNNTLTIRRNYPAFGFTTNDSTFNFTSQKLHTRIFFDRSTVEIFINNGEAVMSSRIYPNVNQRDISLFAIGGQAKFDNVNVWDIVACE